MTTTGVDLVAWGAIVAGRAACDRRGSSGASAAHRDRCCRCRGQPGPGEEMQLYCAQRTKQCFKIGVARCVSIQRIRIRIACAGRPHSQIKMGVCAGAPLEITVRSLDDFARHDGFRNWHDMREFWLAEHDTTDFEGVIIKWEPIV